MEAEKRKLFKMYKQIMVTEKEQRLAKREAIARKKAEEEAMAQQKAREEARAQQKAEEKAKNKASFAQITAHRETCIAGSSTFENAPKGNELPTSSKPTMGADHDDFSDTKRGNNKAPGGSNLPMPSTKRVRDQAGDRPKTRTKKSRWDNIVTQPSPTAPPGTPDRKRKRKRRWSEPVHVVGQSQTDDDTRKVDDSGDPGANQAFNVHGHMPVNPRPDFRAANRRV